jgi:ABC-type branched-subunit amino acid transport system substrate-binding protein
VKRVDPSVGSSLWTLGVIVGVGLLLSVLTFVPAGTRLAASGGAADTGVGTDVPGADNAATNGGGAAGGTAAGGGGSSGASGSNTSGGAATGPAKVVTPAGQTCAAGKNGGSTDTGVTGSSIKLAATVVDDGPGASFLSPVRIGMNAVLNKINKAGGVCGRKLDLILRNDSWQAQLGKQYIQNFVESEKVFALAVVPSSEGLRSANEYIQQQKVPVVGTDGMLIHQYRNPWIWPVATSTISAMHAMAKDAYDRTMACATCNHPPNFGIVFDAKYHFGVEGAYAFAQAVKRLTGNEIDGYDASLKSCVRQFCGVQPDKPSYSSEAKEFNDGCGFIATASRKRCDFAAFLLEPDTALRFLSEPKQGNPTLPTGYYGGAQPLFNRDFAVRCASLCDHMWVWTGYNPPIDVIASQPAVAQYIDDIRQQSSSADVNNQFLQGGYVGMSLLVESLKKVGPNLTRNNLRTVLDSTTFDSGLARPLTWKAGNHFANTAARPFEIQYKSQFNGWSIVSDFIADPWVGQDIPPGE